MSVLVAFEGPDMCGKTEIARELSRQLGVNVYKNSGEWTTDLKSPDYFKNLLVFGGTFLIDFISQVRPQAILDRYYPSEWVYSRLFDRETDNDILRRIDEKFAESGGKIVLFRRKSYNGIQDDLHSYIDEKLLMRLDALYEDFSKWTTCPVLTVWVDDEDLNREVSEIREWLNA
jgi:thymidylate kinase